MSELCLAWSEHHANFFSSAESLCASENLTDVTLCCGPRSFGAHKLVLCLCSSYFNDILNRSANNNAKIIVYLKDVLPRHMEMLLRFMYRGRVSVDESDLVPLLEAARGLGIKGLTNDGQGSNRTGSKRRGEPSLASASSKKLKEEVVVLEDEQEEFMANNEVENEGFGVVSNDIEDEVGFGDVQQDIERVENKDLSQLYEEQDVGAMSSQENNLNLRQMGEPVTYWTTRSKSGRPLYASGNFGYTLRSRQGQRVYLDCRHRHCSGRAQLVNDKLLQTAIHTCSGMSEIEFRLLEIEHEMKVLAETSLEAPSVIIEHVLKRNEDLREHVKFKSLMATLSKRRAKALKVVEKELN